MRVFSLEKFVGRENLPKESVLLALELGWPQEFEGEEVINGRIGGSGCQINENWTMEKEEYDRMYKAMGAIQEVDG
jgi:hypothetical protein